jgi:hypothetical protein
MPPARLMLSDARRRRNLQRTPLRDGIERREDHLVREIAGHAEQHQRIGVFDVYVSHDHPGFLRRPMFMHIARPHKRAAGVR